MRKEEYPGLREFLFSLGLIFFFALLVLVVMILFQPLQARGAAPEGIIGTWVGGTSQPFTLTIFSIHPVTDDLRMACETAGYSKITDGEIKRLADEIANFPSTETERVEIFIARISINGRDTLARITYGLTTKVARIEFRIMWSGPRGVLDAQYCITLRDGDKEMSGTTYGSWGKTNYRMERRQK